ncbi:hypothetical protein TNCV_2346101 [Trichonephila clavipes]|nr:hypothetical protein TNCV_2346101 [Trichonephila clavipes]
MRGTLMGQRYVDDIIRHHREERLEVPDSPQGVFSQNWGGIEKNRIVTRMVLKAKANDRRKNLATSHEEFRGP